jgi:hypothetical protein
MSDIRFIQLNSYTTPKVTEVKNRDFVSYGEDNNYFQYLIDRYNGSPTNNAIINAISEMIYGKGLDATDSSRKPDQYAQMISLFKSDVIRKACYDLKLMGQCALQIIYSKDRKQIAQVAHIPVETLRAEKAGSKGEVEAYYYFKDWSKYKYNDTLKRIPAFQTSQENIEIMYIKPYKAGFFYYSPVSYQGGLQYAELEEEIGNFHLNNIMNGMSPSMLINFNNGVPNEEERELIEQRIYKKFSSSSNAGKFILAFNDNPDTAASIEPVQLSDAHQQYQFLSEESSKKIMVSHRVVSPMLFGVKDKTGFGNNAEEIQTASTLMDNTVIRPFQRLLIDCLDQILAYNNISLNLYFKTLQPLEFTDLENVEDEETKEEETGVKLKKQVCNHNDVSLSKEVMSQIADDLISKGEEYGDDWILVDEQPALEDETQIQDYFAFAKVVSGDARKRSTQDTDIFRVRYAYTAGRKTEGKSREFCKKMLAANKVYRMEDLNKQSTANSELAPKGENSYNIFLYKGGVNCSHYWMRRIYLKKGNKKISVTRARQIISELPKNQRKGAKFETNPPEVAQIASNKNNNWRIN